MSNELHHTSSSQPDPAAGPAAGHPVPQRRAPGHHVPSPPTRNENNVSTGPRRPPQRRGSIWKKLGLAGLLVAAAAGAYLTFTQHGRDVRDTYGGAIQTMATVQGNPNLIFQDSHSDIVNILLIGRDVNYKQVYDKHGRNISHKVDEHTVARSDTMIVVSLDKNRNTIRMVSLPRDARVYIPENPIETGRNKLNAAHAFGGVPLLEKTLHDELGLTVHHYAVIRFDGFKKLIDEVGGVYVDVLGALKRDGSRGHLFYEDKWGGWKVDLQPGKQWLNGDQAHGYVRFRMDLEGDPGRIRRQQSVMRGLAQRLKSLPPWKLPGVVKQIRQQFETDMSDTDIASAGMFAKGIGDTSKIQPITLFGVYGTRGSLILNKPKNELLLETIFGSTFNPDHFLQNSPWTRGDEIGPNYKDNPATMALLREAGIIKGGPTAGESSRIAAGEGTANSNDSPPPVDFSSAPPREQPSRDYSSSDQLSVESSSDARGADSPPPIASERSSHRRRSRRERSREQSETSPRESSSANDSPPVADSPIPRAEENTAPTGNEDSGSELSVESPVPRPE